MFACTRPLQLYLFTVNGELQHTTASSTEFCIVETVKKCIPETSSLGSLRVFPELTRSRLDRSNVSYMRK